MPYNVYFTDQEGKNREFWQIVWTRAELEFRMNWSAHHARQAIFTGWPTRAGSFWVVVESRTKKRSRKVLEVSKE